MTRKPRNNLTQEQARFYLRYDPITGLLFWRNPIGRRASVGSVAGYKNSFGHINLSIAGQSYTAHRLIWLHVHGVWPKDQIDHINHIPDDNRIENLREATQTENQKNKSVQKNSTSGILGVTYCNTNYKWVASINIDGKFTFLGRFKDKFEAICCRKSAENKNGYHENHGR